VIPKFITSVLAGKSPTIFGDGTQSRDFSYVQNVIEANLTACVAPKQALGESFNIACGGRITLLDLLNTINAALGTSVQPKFEPPRAGDILHSQADIAKAERFMGWRPSVDFNEGIRRTIDWYRRQGAASKVT
jgi:nucleoside-diphosphate-sugar epimerase